MPITIYDVAREANVSMATVSRVINGNPNVKPTTRKKVMGVIERLGYRPNAVARGLASKKTTTIGVVIPDISNPFFAEVVRGIEDIANMYHYSIILSNSDQRKEKELILINTLLEKQVDGLLFMGGVVSDDHIEVLRTSNVPIVLSATNEKEHRFPSVDIDHTEAAKEAVQFLIDEGNRRVAMISGPLEDPNTGLARFNGYKQAMEANGLHWKEDWVRIGNYKYDSALQATRYFLNLDEPPTAIFAANDEMAIGAVHAIQDAGLRVPEDIEVMGFDGIAMASMVRPLLTTVAQPMYDIGAVSMRLLTKLINKEEVANPTVRLQHELWIRQSTKKKRG